MYLNCKTYFSFRYGTFGTQELVSVAVEAGVTSLALTNINSTCDTWDFVMFCQEAGIKPVVGVEIRNGNTMEYILLAANNRGFRWINAFLSFHIQEQKPFPPCALNTPFFDDLWDGFVIYPTGKKEVRELLANERIGILPGEVNRLFGIDVSSAGDKLVIRQ